MKGDVQLVISLNASGEINISGPIQDKVLCYGLLGIARDLVKDYVPQAITVPKGVIIPPLRGVGN